MVSFACEVWWIAKVLSVSPSSEQTELCKNDVKPFTCNSVFLQRRLVGENTYTFLKLALFVCFRSADILPITYNRNVVSQPEKAVTDDFRGQVCT